MENGASVAVCPFSLPLDDGIAGAGTFSHLSFVYAETRAYLAAIRVFLIATSEVQAPLVGSSSTAD